MKLIWSSKNNKFIGHAMTHDELASLTDVYTVLKPDYRQRQTPYVLQTMWRDLTSDFDIMGPHYTSDVTFSHGTFCRIQSISFMCVVSIQLLLSVMELPHT